MYYTPETLEAAGIRDESMLLLATVSVGLIKVAEFGLPFEPKSRNPYDETCCNASFHLSIALHLCHMSIPP